MAMPILFLVLKTITLVSATAQAAGSIGLSAIEALQPNKWQLLMSCTIAIIMSEGAAHLLLKRMAGTGAASGREDSLA